MMQQHMRAAFAAAALVATLLLATSPQQCLAEFPEDPALINCIVSTTEDPEKYRKVMPSCFECQKKTLQTPNATAMNYKDPTTGVFTTVAVADLPTYECPDAPIGERGEQLCVILDVGGVPKDTSMKTCRDCSSQCLGWDVCKTMVWAYTEVPIGVGGMDLAAFMATCPPNPPPPPPVSPAPTSPAVLILPSPDQNANSVFSCLAYNVSAQLIEASQKNCTDCAQYCMSSSICQSMVFGGTTVYKEDIPTFFCAGDLPPVDANSTERCVIQGTEGDILDSSMKTCYDCWWQCAGWDACATMTFYYQAFDRTTVLSGSAEVCGA